MRLVKLGRRIGLRLDRIMVTFFQVLLLFPLQLKTASSSITTRQAIPKFLPAPTNVTVHKGELAVLRCFIKNLGPKVVVWRKATDEHPLTIGELTFTPEGEISVDHEELGDGESRWNLLIKNVKPNHAGVYECQISAMGTYTHYVALYVLDEPLHRKPQLTVTGTEYVNQLSDIHLKCNATGVLRAPEDVDWFFEGNRIHTSHPNYYNRIEILERKPVPGRSYISELIIHRSTMKDQGNYICRGSDLNHNSMKVHVLNADKNNPIRPRAPGSEEKQSTRNASQSSRARSGVQVYRKLMIFLILILVYSFR